MQRNFVGSAGEHALREGFAFYRVVPARALFGPLASFDVVPPLPPAPALRACYDVISQALIVARRT